MSRSRPLMPMVGSSRFQRVAPVPWYGEKRQRFEARCRLNTRRRPTTFGVVEGEAMVELRETLTIATNAIVDAWRTWWNDRAAEYVAVGSPMGPADDPMNVARWIVACQSAWRREMEEWVIADTQARLHGEGGVPYPEARA